jgi:hypothetical protein
MTVKRTLVPLIAFVATVVGVAAQQARPANVPIHTWVREDLFAGFMEDDLTRFERGEKKLAEYLAETPVRPEAAAWLAGVKLYRGGRAFREGKSADGERLVREATELMDTASAQAPDNLGVNAVLGGSVVLLANKVPEQYYLPLMERGRIAFAKLYSVQSKAMAQLPHHIKGELLAGVAETEFRAGDKARATAALNEIIKELPGTPYAKTAASWLAAPDKVTRDTKIVCQSCHDAGRLSSWEARQKG